MRADPSVSDICCASVSLSPPSRCRSAQQGLRLGLGLGLDVGRPSIVSRGVATSPPVRGPKSPTMQEQGEGEEAAGGVRCVRAWADTTFAAISRWGAAALVKSRITSQPKELCTFFSLLAIAATCSPPPAGAVRSCILRSVYLLPLSISPPNIPISSLSHQHPPSASFPRQLIFVSHCA